MFWITNLHAWSRRGDAVVRFAYLAVFRLHASTDDCHRFRVVFPAAGLRIVVELPSSLVAVRFPSHINPEVTFVRDDTIIDGSSSLVHPMSVFSRCLSV